METGKGVEYVVNDTSVVWGECKKRMEMHITSWKAPLDSLSQDIASIKCKDMNSRQHHVDLMDKRNYP